MSKFELPFIEKQEVIFDEFVKVQRDQLLFPNGERHPYYTLITPAPAVVILGMTPDGYLVLNNEYRHPAGAVLLGAPGGYLEVNEDPLTGGRREFLEETGCTGESASLIGSAFPYPGLSAQKVYYVYMEGVRKAQDPSLDPMEVMQTVLKKPEEVIAAVKQGQAVDGSLCTALFFLNLRAV